MEFAWQEAFQEKEHTHEESGVYETLTISSIAELKEFLDEVHIRECLLRPLAERPDYPLVDPRALLPSFEPEMYEYDHLPGFSLLAFNRPTQPFNEIFQYDILHPVMNPPVQAQGPCCPLESHILHANFQTVLGRMPRQYHEHFRKQFGRGDLTLLDVYPELLPYLLEMDRAHVLDKDQAGHFQLAGVFASFPSDIDGELKRFGMRMGKFKLGDNELYVRNRNFVMQFLMELYGFPVASERRTSAALFARKLHKMGESFLVRVLGQSDRVLTTIWNPGFSGRYPLVEKVALIKVDEEQEDVIETLSEARAFVDKARRIAIIRVCYQQHSYDADNVRQDRALSVFSQQVIHPLTGEYINGINIIRDSTNLILRLNDIARGEYYGRVVFKRTEVVENTDTDEKRLKFLYAWLTKHQRRIIGYSEEFFTNVCKILDNYLENLNRSDTLDDLRELQQDVRQRYSFIKQARQIRYLEEIRARYYKGERLGYERMLVEAVALLHGYKFEVVLYFEGLVQSAIHHVEAMLNDRYLRKNYIERPEGELTKNGQEIRRKYGKLVLLLDEFKAIQKSHQAHSVDRG